MCGTQGQNLEWLRSGRTDLVGTRSVAGRRADTDRDLLDMPPGNRLENASASPGGRSEGHIARLL